LEKLLNIPLSPESIEQIEDLNYSDIDLDDGPYYIEARLVMGGRSVWKNVSIDASSTQEDLTIKFDLMSLFNEYDFSSYEGYAASQYHSDSLSVGRDKRDSHTMLYDGSAADPVANTPLLVTAIYKQNPADVPQGDIVALLENLVYYDFLRIAIDHQYAHEYKSKWNEMENNHAQLKPLLMLVGVGMVALGAAECIFTTGGLSAVGIPTMAFGVDMIVGNVWGWSPLDEMFKAILWSGTTLSG